MALGSSVMDTPLSNHEVNLHNTCYSGVGSSEDLKWTNFSMDNSCVEQNENLTSHHEGHIINGQSMYNIGMGNSQWDVFGIETDGVIDVETTCLSEDDVSSIISEVQTEANRDENLSFEKFQSANKVSSLLKCNMQPKRAKQKRSKNSAQQDIPNLGYELDNAYKILQHLMSPAYKAINKNFMEAVTVGKDEYTDYYDVITKPMWLSKVKSKLLEGEYHNISKFVGDIRIILENCYQYHGPYHPVTKKALKLETMLEQKLALLPRDLKEKTAIEITSSELIESAGFKGVGRQRIPRLAIGDTSLILQYVSHAKAQREREAKRRHLEEKKAEKEAEYQEILEWENKLLEENITLIKSMWELPQIGHFLFLAHKVLNVPEVPQYMLERMFFMPRESVCLATIMTSLLSSPQQRAVLDQKPPMPYRIWDKRLKAKVQTWYKVFQSKGRNVIKVFENIGIESDFFLVLGDSNPYENNSFHELTIHQRVWLLKSLCDYCLHNHKTVQDAVGENALTDQKDYVLGSDRNGNTYNHFPQFCGQDLRIYKQAYCKEPPVLTTVILPSVPVIPDKEENCSRKMSEEDNKLEGKNIETKEINKKEANKETPAASTRSQDDGAVESKMEEIVSNDLDKQDLGLKINISVKKGTNKGVPAGNTRSQDEKDEESKMETNVPDMENKKDISVKANEQASEDKKGSSEAPRDKCKIYPDINKFNLVADSVEGLRQLIDAFTDKPEVSAMPRNKRKGKTPTMPQCEIELKESLCNLLTELEPWESKLQQAAKRMRIRLRKEWDDYQAEVLKKQTEKEPNFWDSEPEEEKPSSSGNSSHDEKSDASEVASSSSDEEVQEVSKKRRVIKEEEANNSDASASSESNSHTRCLRKRKIRTDKNLSKLRNSRRSSKKDKIVSQYACNTDSEAQGQYYWETLRQIIVSSSKKEPSDNTLNSDQQMSIKLESNIPVSSSSLVSGRNGSANNGAEKQMQSPCRTGSSSSLKRRIFTSRNKTSPNGNITPAKQVLQLNNVKKQKLNSGASNSTITLVTSIVNADNKIINTYTSHSLSGTSQHNSNDRIFQKANVSLLKQALKQRLDPKTQTTETSKVVLNKESTHSSDMTVLSMRGNLKKKLNVPSEPNTVDSSHLTASIQQYDILKSSKENTSQQPQRNMSSSTTVLPTSFTSGPCENAVGSGNSIPVPAQSCSLLSTSTVQPHQARIQLPTPTCSASNITQHQQQNIKLIPALTQDGKRVYLQYITGHTSQPEISVTASQTQSISTLKAGQLQIQNKKPLETSSIPGNLLLPSDQNTVHSALLTQQINTCAKATSTQHSNASISSASHSTAVCVTQKTQPQATSEYFTITTTNGHGNINSNNTVLSSTLSNSSASAIVGQSTPQNSKVISIPLSQFLQQNHTKLTTVPTSDGQKIILTLLPKSPNINQGLAESNVFTSPVTNSISQMTISSGLQNQNPSVSPHVSSKSVCASLKEPPPLGPITPRKILNEKSSSVNMTSNGLSQITQATAVNVVSAVQSTTKVPSQLPPLAYISSPTRFQNSFLINSQPSVKTSSVGSASETRNKVYVSSHLSEVPATQGVALIPCNPSAQQQFLSAQNSLNGQNSSVYASSQPKTFSGSKAFTVKHPATSSIPTQTLQPALHCNPQNQSVSFSKMNTIILQPSNALPTSKSSFRASDVSPVKMMILTTAPNPANLATVSLNKETHQLPNATAQFKPINSVADKRAVKILPKQPVFSTVNEIVAQPTSFVRNILPVSPSPVAMQNKIDSKQNALPVVATSVVGGGNFQILSQSANAAPIKGRTSLFLVNENNQLVLSPQFVGQYPALDGVTEYMTHNAM